MEPFLGEIELFAGNFAPKGWAPCNGQLTPIAQYSALFSLLGTTYGGDGIRTFALPDLRGRVPTGMNNNQGHTSGQESVTLTALNMPSGAAPRLLASSSAADSPSPAGAVLAAARIYTAPPATVPMGADALDGGGGGGQSAPVSVMEPRLALSFCIALQGIYPSRS